MRKLLLIGAVVALPFCAFAQQSVQIISGGSPVGAGNPLPTAASSLPSAGPTTDASNTITVGGTFQTVSALNTSRLGFEFVNNCNIASQCTTTANNCYLFFAASGTPTKGVNTITVPAGASYLRSSGRVPSDAISATCDGTGDHFRLAVQ